MKRTSIRRVGTKRARQLGFYSVLKKDFLKRRPYCEIFEPCCTRRATEIHHMNGRNGARLLDIDYWLPACRACHSFIHDRPQYAREMGFLK